MTEKEYVNMDYICTELGLGRYISQKIMKGYKIHRIDFNKYPKKEVDEMIKDILYRRKIRSIPSC